MTHRQRNLRTDSVKFLVPVLLACGGLGSPPPEPAAPPPKVAPPASASESELGNKYLVILGSKRNREEEIPGLKTLAAHPETGLQAKVFSSSHFKNLMPCYTVTYAGSFESAKEAKAASATLTSLGIENYVKNTGAFVGVSPEIDAWCNRAPQKSAHDFAVSRQGNTYIPIDLPEQTESALLESAPSPKPMSNSYDAWEQPLAIQTAGDLTVGGTVELVSLADGSVVSCHVTGFDFLTLGTPHFGYLQNPPANPQPACGSPKPYASLDCRLPEDQRYLRLGTGARPMAWPLGAEQDAARATEELKKNSDFSSLPANADRRITVRTVGDWLLVEASLETEGGICGGEAFLLSGLFKQDWTPVIPIRRFEPGAVVGVVDLEANGTPDLVLHQFADETRIVNGEGEVQASESIDFCDCPC